MQCSAFLGGISANFDSNVLVNKNSDWAVVEADEFDRSFLHLSPYCSIVTAMDPIIWISMEIRSILMKVFSNMLMKIDPGGWCIAREGIELHTLSKYCTYNIESTTSDYSANHIGYEAGVMVFYVDSNDYKGRKFELGIPGIHNVLNALSCIVLMEKIGLSYPEIKKGLLLLKV